METKDKSIETAKKYLARLSNLVNIHTLETKERFLPYYTVIYNYLYGGIPPEARDTKYNDLKLCLAIVCNTIDNAWGWSNEIDGELFNLLYKITQKNGFVDYTEFMGKTPIPFQEYGKFRYDLRDNLWKSC
jgi:hypothetical protein